MLNGKNPTTTRIELRGQKFQPLLDSEIPTTFPVTTLQGVEALPRKLRQKTGNYIVGNLLLRGYAPEDLAPAGVEISVVTRHVNEVLWRKKSALRLAFWDKALWLIDTSKPTTD